MTLRLLSFPLIFAFALTCTPVLRASGFSSDELAVRAVYSAVVLRTQIASIASSYYTDHLSTDTQLSVQLAGIHCGPISEIVSMPLSKAVTEPSGELLISSTSSYSIRKQDSTNAQVIGSGLQVKGWGLVNARYGFNDSHIFDAPVGKLLETDLAGPNGQYSRYLMFSVVLSSRGKERVYNALALFRDGSPEVVIADYILGRPEVLIGEHLTSELINLPRVLPLS